MSDIVVQFAHGLESGPQGTKVRALTEAGFLVRAPDMQMSVRRMDRDNSVARQLFRLPEVQALGVGLAVGAGASLAKRSLRAAAWTAGLGAGWAAVRQRAWRQQALRRSFEACVVIQGQALQQYGPDVLVGSSWGGAVALELVRRGWWRGPTVLLAPAYGFIARKSGWAGVHARLEDLRRASLDVSIVVYHDPTDAVVPYEDSMALARGGEIELMRVSAGGHRLLGLLDDGSLAERIRMMAEWG